MPITDLLNDFGWIGCSKILGHRPMHSEMTDELMCLTFGGLWCLISRAVEDSCQELTMLPITKSCIFCHSSFQCMFGIDFFVLFRSWKVALTDFCRAQHSFSRWLQLGGKPQNNIACTLTRSQRGGRVPIPPPGGVWSLGHTVVNDKKHFRERDSVHPKAHEVHQKHVLFLSPTILHQHCFLETGSVSHTDSLNKIAMLVQGGNGKWGTTARGGKVIRVSC